ncbi:hypothetical protein A3C98_00445 [Candidatus Roizmanbacteria bacterium RIFCSPHIGHO2_02_FULL_37_15]|uniref:Transketolase n=1 Tax=Candidatus Roizmanbacteria bacterium RIFCSPLOWO2_01_FULL_37_16 TaxID=1802058 RepID=A0A1F7IQT4_9BACT|nr:MAG: hypothetical protein A2859_02620 [Candidatus Roizmanbacteria bacterium RIFCSPHIGHO2_01_FULL_37_16b]OGK22203.1 MAG: hypothetical protein A3C98_00445 [Candidatus Roizmanbacteria bacterium RIFCSPHIGHO2_02_FULL_37_15]OGK45720.1 MAG: hypothetical protein A3B40_05580 [Candidatus Roizmanbacteria bacterium RIFCSPLOWO2_01_FULL_37_16]
MQNKELLEKLCRLIRYDILTSTSTAGSGHLTTSLSAVELMAVLFFAKTELGESFFRYDLKNPSNLANDKIIFSKGHASPLLYSLFHAAGAVSNEELLTLRKFNSKLEGHPTPRFPFVDVATGSLGQGLSIGLGMALGLKLRIKNSELKIKREPKVWVLLGDSEMAEGQVWEALGIAAFYKLNNLIGIIDVNRLGQRGETMLGWDLETYKKRIEAFGWEVVIVEDGHNIETVYSAFRKILSSKPYTLTPKVIIAKTVKGKGVSFLENKEGWHGKVLDEKQLKVALDELGEIDFKVRGNILLPNFQFPISPSTSSGSRAKSRDNFQSNPKSKIQNEKKLQFNNYKLGDLVSTRQAFGDALVKIGKTNPDVVVLDAEVSNSTFSQKFKEVFPQRFFEMFIAEQNMVSTALGLAKIGFKPFVSTFSAFLNRAFDQVRIAQYSEGNLKMVGSHAGVFVGPDGPSQEGLEDISLMRSILESIVLHPCDAVSTYKLTLLLQEVLGIVYLRTMRDPLPVIYDLNEELRIGGSKILRQSEADKLAIVAAGVTVHEALKAYDLLLKEKINVCVVDAYSIKPLDQKTIFSIGKKLKNIIVIEDHYPFGGLGDAVLSALSQKSEIRNPSFDFRSGRPEFIERANSETVNNMQNSKFPSINFEHLCVRKIPRSGQPGELLRYEEIDARAIVKKIKEML